MDIPKYSRQLSQHSDSTVLPHQDLLQHATIRRVTRSIDIPYSGATSLPVPISLFIKFLYIACKPVFFKTSFDSKETNSVPGYLSRYSDSLQAIRSGDRIPVGARFSASVQSGPGAHPASYTMVTGSFPGVMGPISGVGHPPHLAPSWPVLG